MAHNPEVAGSNPAMLPRSEARSENESDLLDCRDVVLRGGMSDRLQRSIPKTDRGNW